MVKQVDRLTIVRWTIDLSDHRPVGLPTCNPPKQLNLLRHLETFHHTVSSWPRCLESRCFALESLKVKHQMYTNQPLDADFFNRLWLNLSLCCYFNVRRRSVTVSSSGAQLRPFDTHAVFQTKQESCYLAAILTCSVIKSKLNCNRTRGVILQSVTQCFP